mmetsp:Transcript_796/g.2143  ORF Transcript_796/g.2143 Transcript_796/m.2143 type:complete len:386 (-) Transcript_796:3143-4300(-)
MHAPSLSTHAAVLQTEPVRSHKLGRPGGFAHIHACPLVQAATPCDNRAGGKVGAHDLARRVATDARVACQPARHGVVPEWRHLVGAPQLALVCCHALHKGGAQQTLHIHLWRQLSQQLRDALALRRRLCQEGPQHQQQIRAQDDGRQHQADDVHGERGAVHALHLLLKDLVQLVQAAHEVGVRVPDGGKLLAGQRGLALAAGHDALDQLQELLHHHVNAVVRHLKLAGARLLARGRLVGEAGAVLVQQRRALRAREDDARLGAREVRRRLLGRGGVAVQHGTVLGPQLLDARRHGSTHLVLQLVVAHAARVRDLDHAGRDPLHADGHKVDEVEGGDGAVDLGDLVVPDDVDDDDHETPHHKGAHEPHGALVGALELALAGAGVQR